MMQDETTTIEQYAIVIWDGRHTDGGRIAVYEDWHSFFERLTMGDIIVDDLYAGRVFGRRALIADTCRRAVMRDAAADAIEDAAADAAAPVLNDASAPRVSCLEEPFQRMTATLQLGA